MAHSVSERGSVRFAPIFREALCFRAKSVNRALLALTSFSKSLLSAVLLRGHMFLRQI